MERRYLTVTALNRYLKFKFDNDSELKSVLLKAEISNLKKHSSGHFYFTLKDQTSEISAIMFSSNAQRILFSPQEGQKVIVEGYVSIYEARGNYQIYVNKMSEDGIGDLYLAYEQLKSKLDQLGFFDAKHKKSIPVFPKAIGVITSPTGAAVRDIIHIINSRYPLAKIIVYPALVQGIGAKESIVNQINQANQDLLVDTIIVGRGGGSIEDLWAFNEEIVAKAIFYSMIPIISAVGHETDFTISDFVADRRAATPSQAAEIAVPDKKALLTLIDDRIKKASTLLSLDHVTKKNQLRKIMSSYVVTNPQRLFQQKIVSLDYLKERLNQSSPERFVNQKKIDVTRLFERLQKGYFDYIQITETDLIHKLEKLELSNPLSIMKKGFSVVRQKDMILTSIKSLKISDTIDVILPDGEISAEIKSIKKGNSLWKKN